MEQRGLVPVAYLLLQGQGRVLLVRPLSNSIEGPWEIPHVDVPQGELPTEVLLRMAKEGFGVLLSPDDLTLVHTFHCVGANGEGDRVMYMFVAHWLPEYTILGGYARGEISWVLPEHLPPDIPGVICDIVVHIDHGTAYSELRLVVENIEAGLNEPVGA